MDRPHKPECKSYAEHCAERALEARGRFGAPALEVQILATELLSIGDVTCICSELPS